MNSFLKNGGETGKLIEDYDWSQTRLGSIDTWPVSLKVTLNNLLHSSFPMLLFWGDDMLCFYNDAFRPSLGYDGAKHPAIGRQANAMWEEIWDFIGPLLRNVTNKGKSYWFEDQPVPYYRNGKIEDIYWTFSYSPAYNDEGEINGALVTCIETTKSVKARKTSADTVAVQTEELGHAYEKILESNAYLQSVINLFKEPLQVLEPIIENGTVVDFRYKLTNAAYSAYANKKPEEIYGKKVSEIFPGYLQTSSFTNNAEVFVTGKPQTWEIHYNQDGLDLYNRMSATKMDDALVVNFTDFSQLKHLQLQLEKKISELERSNKQLEEFAHAASHDLKEPIRKIQIFTQLLKSQLQQRFTTQEMNTLSRIENAAERMGLLVDDLLQYSHVRQLPQEKETIDLHEIIQQALQDLDMEVEQKQATIKYRQLPTVQGYRRQLQQLFQNLLSNALKYSKKEEPLFIEIDFAAITVDENPFYAIHVKDNGIGFDQEHADSIFQLFTRLHSKNNYSGTGIGLSIVKKIVENHNGQVTAISETGKGTTFTVLLPAE